MAKLNIYSDEWCDMIFIGKNHEYGAFELRKASSKRHLIAVISAVAFFSLAICSPMIIKSIIPEADGPNEKVTELINVDLTPPPKVKDPEIVVPPPVLKSAMQYVAPVISEADDVKPEDQMKTQDELTESKVNISTQNIVGKDEDPNAVDIDDLNQNQGIVDQTKEKIWTFVEQQAEFPGGEEERLLFLQKNVKYPELATESGIEGTVHLSFVVNKNGKISNVKVLRPIGGGCDEEAIRVVKMMPSWLPGKQNGEAVPSQFSMPIKFSLK